MTKEELKKCLYILCPHFLKFSILTVFQAKKCDFFKTIKESKLKFSGCF